MTKARRAKVEESKVDQLTRLNSAVDAELKRLSAKVVKVKPPVKGDFRSTHGPNTVDVTVEGNRKDWESGRMLQVAEQEAGRHYRNPTLYRKQGGQYDDDAFELYTEWRQG